MKISISDFIKLVMKKKNITNIELTRMLNDLEDKIGDESRTYPQNINDYLKNHREMGSKMAFKIEYVLGLPKNTLVNMSILPKTKDSKNELKQLQLKVEKVGKNE